MSVTALDLREPDDREPTRMFDVAPFTPPISEIRVALKSASNLPALEGTHFGPDQAVSGTFVGNCKGEKKERGPAGTYIQTWSIEVTDIALSPS